MGIKNNSRGVPGVATGQDLVGAQLNDIRRDLATLKQDQSALTAVTVSIPEPCTPDFVLEYIIESGKIVPSCCVNLPAGTEELTTWVIRDADCTDQATFDASQKSSVNAPDDPTVTHFEYLWNGKLLQPDTLYRLIVLTAKGSTPGKVRNPATGPLYTDPPLATFTTPSAFGAAANRPHVGNIIENNLDDSTSRKFDAFVVVQVFAPASNSANATGTVSITSNSTLVTGSGTAFSAPLVGSAIEVNGEMHLIASVTDATHLNVDFPFKQTLSGQTAVIKTLQTFGTSGTLGVAPKFALTDDANARALALHHALDEAELLLTNIKIRVPEFFAAKRYNYTRNLLIGEGNSRISSVPLVTQTFTAGNFTTATAGIPELTNVAFQYNSVAPYNPNKRFVSFVADQPNPPVGLERAEIFKRIAGTGSVTSSGTTINGSGTAFSTELAPGHFIIVGSQTLEVDTISSDILMTVRVAPVTPFTAQPYTLSVLVDSPSLLVGKFHPSTGGRIRIQIGEIKTKKLISHTFVLILYSLNGQTRTVTETFTPNGIGGDDTDVPSGLSAPLFEWTAEGRFRVQGMQASTNSQSRKEIYLVITDNIGNYINLTTGLVTTSEPAARLATGNKGHINLSNLRLKKYRTAFGASTDIYAYYYVQNDFGSSGLSAASPLSTAVNLATPEDYMGDRSTVRGVDVEVTQLSPMNILLNGDLYIEFLESPPTADVNCDSFFLRTPTAYPIQGAANITTVSANLRWDRASHSLRWLTNAKEICLPLKQRLEPAGFYTLTFMVRSDTSGWSTTPSFHIYNGQQSVAIDNIVNTISKQITFNDTAYHLYYATLQFTTATGATLTAALESSIGAGDYAAHFLCIDLNTVSHDVYMDKFMLVRGQQQMAYAPNGEEANANLPSTVAPSMITYPDFVSLGATKSGRYPQNDGGLIDFQPY